MASRGVFNLALGLALLVLAAGAATATPILPVSLDRISDHRNAISGGGVCTTSGSYDAATFLFQMFHECDEQVLHGEGFDVRLLSERSTLTSFVNEEGRLLGGNFSWFGALPDAGMVAPDLLGFGTVRDVLYATSPADFPLPGTFHAVIDLTFLHPLLESTGPLVYWHAYTSVLWPDCLEAFDGLPGFECRSWSTSLSFGRDSNFTGTNFYYLDRAFMISTPPALSLLLIGFVALVLRSSTLLR